MKIFFIFVKLPLIFININEIGRNKIFFIILNGYNSIDVIFIIIFFIAVVIITLNLTIYLLNDNIYINPPKIIPTNMYNRISPLYNEI